MFGARRSVNWGSGQILNILNSGRKAWAVGNHAKIYGIGKTGLPKHGEYRHIDPIRDLFRNRLVLMCFIECVFDGVVLKNNRICS